jgi:hypothetical protein
MVSPTLKSQGTTRAPSGLHSEYIKLARSFVAAGEECVSRAVALLALLALAARINETISARSRLTGNGQRMPSFRFAADSSLEGDGFEPSVSATHF